MPHNSQISLSIPLQMQLLHHLLSQPVWFLIFSSLGLFSLLKHVTHLIGFIFISFLRPPKCLKSYGSWALITGSTDGIGKAFAFQLAQQGLHLILVSRNPDKLSAVSHQIQATHPNTKVKIFPLDFTTSDLPSGIRKLETFLQGLDVGLLINNVGLSYQWAKYFHEVEEEAWMSLVRVNVEGTTRVTKAVLKGMVERKRGAIVNMGSGAATVIPSHPFYAVYAATKAYVDQLSRSLHVEYKSHGIDVQCQVPLYVATRMASRVAAIHEPTMFAPSAEEYARAAIKRIGYEARSMPYWGHALQWHLASAFPEFLVNLWRYSIGIRKRQRCR
uniref:Uncharacterized protein n=1 Tax=Kalanchoe fedtschenkoi TaxID=63787 RepID=A0A7N0UVF1_KALFE